MQRSSEPGKRAQFYGIGRGQGLLIIAENIGHLGGWCAEKASASGIWDCAVVAHVVISLHSPIVNCVKNVNEI